MWDNKPVDYTPALGIGKMISSITMTLFYVLLWQIGTTLYNVHHSFMTPSVICFAVIRIILCLLPKNKWKTNESSQSWGIWRNIPFFLLGMNVMMLYALGSPISTIDPEVIWYAILISFACYIPVVFSVKKNPKIGMFMIPKSCAYIAIILTGFSFPSL